MTTRKEELDQIMKNVDDAFVLLREQGNKLMILSLEQDIGNGVIVHYSLTNEHLESAKERFEKFKLAIEQKLNIE